MHSVGPASKSNYHWDIVAFYGLDSVVPGAIIALIPLSLSLSGIVALLYVAYGPDALLEFVLSIRNDI